MTEAASTLAAGVIFGVALAAPPGPMNAVIAEESVLRGWIAGVLAGLGAMTADACFLALSYLGVVRIVDQIPALRATMLGVGGALMLYFAYGSARGAASFLEEGAGGNGTDGGTRRGFAKAFVLALSNPYQILFWLTVGVGLLRPGTIDVGSFVPTAGVELSGLLVVRTGSPLLVAGLFVGIGVWVAGFPAALVAAGRRVDRFAPAVASGSAVVLVAFGAWFLFEALRWLL